MTFEQRQVVYHFGPFRFEPREYLLLRNEQQVAVTAKALATLQSLVESRGSLITKRELMEAVWPNTSVEENNLERNIYATEGVGGAAERRTVYRNGPADRLPVRRDSDRIQAESPDRIRSSTDPATRHPLLQNPG